MIGLVLVTHGNLANEFISAMQHVVGKQAWFWLPTVIWQMNLSRRCSMWSANKNKCKVFASGRRTIWKCAVMKYWIK